MSFSYSEDPIDGKLVRLRSSDGIEFEVLERVAIMSNTIKNIIEDPLAPDVIPMHTVDGKTLAMVIEYCDLHSRPDAEDEKMKRLDSEFLKNLDRTELISLGVAAIHLDVPGLSGIVCMKHAEKIKNMTVEEIHQYFGIKSDSSTSEVDDDQD